MGGSLIIPPLHIRQTDSTIDNLPPAVYNISRKATLSGRHFNRYDMEAIIAKLSEDWPIFSLLAIIFMKLFQSQIGQLVPKTIQDYFGAKAKLRADEQEHQQTIVETELNLAKFKELSQLSSLSFTEEQLTQLTAETQVQLNEANSFVRGIVSAKLDMVLEKIGSLKTVLYEVKDIQTFILREINNGSDANKAE